MEADAQSLGAISYEFVSQAFILYEDELPDSKAQVKALRSMVGTLLAAENCDAADYDALAAKATQYAAKLFRKPDQCRMVDMNMRPNASTGCPGRSYRCKRIRAPSMLLVHTTCINARKKGWCL